MCRFDERQFAATIHLDLMLPNQSLGKFKDFSRTLAEVQGLFMDPLNSKIIQTVRSLVLSKLSISKLKMGDFVWGINFTDTYKFHRKR